MLPKTLGSYGAPYVNARLLKDPKSQADALFGNRMFEDVAQLTRTGTLAWVLFKTTTASAPATVDPANVTHFTVWGSSSATKPVVAKTDVGKYTITFATSYPDGLVGVTGMESVAETQAVVFTFAGRPNVRAAANYDAKVVAIASNVVTVWVYDNTGTLSDLGGGVPVELPLR